MHILPGRVRIRFKQLKKNLCLAEKLRIFLVHLNGIYRVEINTLTSSCLIYFDQHLEPDVVITHATKFIERVIPKNNQYVAINHRHHAKGQLSNVLTGGAILTLFWGLPPTGAAIPANLSLPMTSAALVTTGYPIFKSGIKHLDEHKRPNYDFWIATVSLISTLMGKGYLGLLTLWLSNLSSYLQQLALKGASHSFSHMLINKGNKISLLDGNVIKHVLPGDVNPGNMVLFNSGDCIPIEGQVLSGQGVVFPNETVAAGDLLESGTVLEKGQVIAKVHRLVEDTSLARLADILEDAVEQPEVGSKLAINYAEKLLPVTMITTSLVYLLTRDISRAISVMLAGAPGPAGLAAPTAISAATGVAAAMGLAVKDGTALEDINNVDLVIFSHDLAQQTAANYTPTVKRLEDAGFKVEHFQLDELDQPSHSAHNEDTLAQAENYITQMHQKGLKVAWVSGPDNGLFVKNADVNIIFCNGKEKTVPEAHIVCYKNEPKQVYRVISLSRKTLRTIKHNVFLVQGISILAELLAALGIISSLPAVGFTLLSTITVVSNSARSLINMGHHKHFRFTEKGTILGLAADDHKCFTIT